MVMKIIEDMHCWRSVYDIEVLVAQNTQGMISSHH